jgi:hypothetical protein
MERDPGVAFDIAEADVTLGERSGFWEVPNRVDPSRRLLLVPEFLQRYDALVLAEIEHRELPNGYDVELALSRGGLFVATPYYNGVSLMPTMQTTRYPKDSVEEREDETKVIGLPDWELMKWSLAEKGITEPIVVIKDEMTETGEATEKARQVTAEALKIDPKNVRTSAPYPKVFGVASEDLASYPGELIGLDFYVRPVQGEFWLEFQSQQSRAALIARQADIVPFIPDMQRAAAFLSTILVPSPEMMQRLVAQSAA